MKARTQVRRFWKWLTWEVMVFPAPLSLTSGLSSTCNLFEKFLKKEEKRNDRKKNIESYISQFNLGAKSDDV